MFGSEIIERLLNIKKRNKKIETVINVNIEDKREGSTLIQNKDRFELIRIKTKYPFNHLINQIVFIMMRLAVSFGSIELEIFGGITVDPNLIKEVFKSKVPVEIIQMILDFTADRLIVNVNNYDNGFSITKYDINRFAITELNKKGEHNKGYNKYYTVFSRFGSLFLDVERKCHLECEGMANELLYRIYIFLQYSGNQERLMKMNYYINNGLLMMTGYRDESSCDIKVCLSFHSSLSYLAFFEVSYEGNTELIKLDLSWLDGEVKNNWFTLSAEAHLHRLKLLSSK